MKLTFVDTLPEVRKDPHGLQAIISEFMDSGYRFAKLEFGENDYKNSAVAYNSIHSAIRASKRAVKISKRGDELYLIRTSV